MQAHALDWKSDPSLDVVCKRKFDCDDHQRTAIASNAPEILSGKTRDTPAQACIGRARDRGGLSPNEVRMPTFGGQQHTSRPQKSPAASASRCSESRPRVPVAAGGCADARRSKACPRPQTGGNLGAKMGERGEDTERDNTRTTVGAPDARLTTKSVSEILCIIGIVMPAVPKRHRPAATTTQPPIHAQLRVHPNTRSPLPQNSCTPIRTPTNRPSKASPTCARQGQPPLIA